MYNVPEGVNGELLSEQVNGYGLHYSVDIEVFGPRDCNFVPSGTRSVTPSRSPSPSQTPSPSVSPSPSPSLSPSLSPSPSASPSPSESVVPVVLQVVLAFESGECQTQNCVNVDPRDNVTIRMAARADTFLFMENTQANRVDCTVAGGNPTLTVGGYACITFVPFADLTKTSLADFDLYRLTSAGLPPVFSEPPDIFTSGTFPNTLSSTIGISTVAAAADCTGLASATPLRFVWRKTTGGPCTIYTALNVEVCSSDGVVSNNENYTNRDGDILPFTAISKDVFCPT